MIPTYWKQAVQELAEHDKVMRNIIRDAGEVALNSRSNAFVTLARSIVGQQISVKAAESIWKKIVAVFPEITPCTIFSASTSLLREQGLSLRKVNYLQDLAHHFINSKLKEADWTAMDNKALIVQLTLVKGIGRWTAEMFLIFHMLRPDVLPLDDVGLQRAISRHYFDSQPVNKGTIHTLAKSWQPWRSVATWYLWRSLDPSPVEY